MTINRRTMVTGTAWAVPTLAITSMAPAVAASAPCDPAKNMTTRVIEYSMTQNRTTESVDIDGASQDGNRDIYVLTNEGTEVAPKGAELTILVRASLPEGYRLVVASDTAQDIRQTDASATSPAYSLTFRLPEDLMPGASYTYDVETFAVNEGGDGYYTIAASSAPGPERSVVNECETIHVVWQEQ